MKSEQEMSPILSQIEDLKAADIVKVLNESYIATRFFGKSKSWFSQKMSNVEKSFTPEELETLRNALYTISIELQEVADDLQ